MLINKKVLMSGADYFDDGFAINALMDDEIPVDVSKAIKEHEHIREALHEAGVQVTKIDPPRGCQDGVYIANWGICRGDTIVLSNLPNKRKGEQAYAPEAFSKLGKRLVYVPEHLKFSGQGDALPCGELLLMGSGYRTDQEVHEFVARELGYKPVSLRAVPKTDQKGKPVINAVTGWPDSFFYDLDLALAVLSPTLIAWCPEAFFPESQDKIRALKGINKIEVSLKEAQEGFACNLVSTGETVVMSPYAPALKKAVEAAGFDTITVPATELFKGGGYIRCTTLTVD